MRREDTAAVAEPVTLTFEEALALAEGHLAQRRLDDAQLLCQRVLEAAPRLAAALHLRGLICAERGHLAEALDFLREATQVDAMVATYFSNLCELCRRAGDLEAAMSAGRQALSLEPENPQAMNNLGIVQFERGDVASAVTLYERATSHAPHYAEAHNNLGNALRTQGDAPSAVEAYGRALAIKPEYAEALNNLGTSLRDLRRSREAEAAYRRALALSPTSAVILSNLALSLIDLERFDEAAAILNQVLGLDPENGSALVCMARLRFDLGQYEQARAAVRDALNLKPDDPEALNVLGLLAEQDGDLDEARGLFQQAIAAKPLLADAHNNLGNVLVAIGRLDQAADAHQRAVALEPRHPAFYFNLVDGRKISTRDDPHLLRMEALALDEASLAPSAVVRLNFALAQAYDGLGDPAAAFRHLLAGNRIERSRINYDEASSLGLFDRIRSRFDASAFSARSRTALGSRLPIFIIGMPRSGTTLVEQILASHSCVQGGGELDALPQTVFGFEKAGLFFPDWAPILKSRDLRDLGVRYLQALRRRWPLIGHVTDKMPANFLLVGLIHMAFPDARIIHVTRNPVDTCLSCFFKLFAGEQRYAYDLAELGRYYRKYFDLMTHWRTVLPPGRMLEVHYEDIVLDLEGGARRLLSHCGLAWEPRCLTFYDTDRPVRTASAHQVRRPIYSTSMGRAEMYSAYLGPLLMELEGLRQDNGPDPLPGS